MKRKELIKTFYDDFKLKKTLWSPWFIQKYFSVSRVNDQRVSTLILVMLFSEPYPANNLNIEIILTLTTLNKFCLNHGD